MQCTDFESRLHEVLDRRQDPSLDKKLISHTRTCEECGQYLASQQALFLSLAGSSVERVSVPSAQAAALRPTVVTPALVLAGILLIGLFVTAAFQGDTSHQPIQTAANVAGSPANKLPSDESVSTRRKLLLPRSLPTVQQLWNEATAQTASIPISEPVACGLRPVANSVSSAWNVLRNSMPRVRATPTSPPTANQTTANQTFCDSVQRITA